MQPVHQLSGRRKAAPIASRPQCLDDEQNNQNAQNDQCCNHKNQFNGRPEPDGNGKARHIQAIGTWQKVAFTPN